MRAAGSCARAAHRRHLQRRRSGYLSRRGGVAYPQRPQPPLPVNHPDLRDWDLVDLRDPGEAAKKGIYC